jgi:sigma-B regulation protein RsbU (phosphoserine phosphatase)
MLFMAMWQAGALIPVPGMARDLSTCGIGVISLAVSITSLAVFAIRKSKSDRVLLWFGIFATIYGIRILLGSEIFRAAFGVSASTADALTLIITYTIQLPAMMFALDLIDSMRTRLAKAMFAVAGGLAIVGCLTVFLRVSGGLMPLVNNVLVVFFFLPTYVWAYSHSGRSDGMRWMRAAFFIFLAFVVYDNLSGFGWVRKFGLEPFGFLIPLTAMGYVAAQKTIASQQKLLAVERELEIARNIQQSILPVNIPQTTGLEIAVRYIPMTQVAGDFYDFVELEDGRLGVLVADVSGHGVPAALIASMLKMAFVSHSAAAADPAQMLAKLNGALCGHFSSHFITAVYAVIDSAAGTMTYSAAAHPPVLVRRGDGSVDELSENGLMLGAFDFAQYVNASTKLGSGDQVLLYTDGLAEGSNVADEEFGIERLKNCFDGGAARSLDLVFAKTSTWTAKVPQQDDLTAVVVARV